MAKDMCDNLTDGSSKSEAALRQLAALLNAVRQTEAAEPAPAAERKQPDMLREPARHFGLTEPISDWDILQDLLERYKDEPEIVQRLQQELLNKTE